MATCKKCGYQNKEGNKYCINCGAVIELTDEEIKKEKAKQTTSLKNWVAYFLIFMGFSTFFGGLITYATSVGTIIQDISAHVATPYIVIGFVLMLIGFAIFLIKTEE
jgi:uncharacterized membrane protein YvbJ